MKPKILLCYLEEDKFSKENYKLQMGFVERLAEGFEETLYLTEENVAQLFLGIDSQKAICITTSSDLAVQMQGLGIAVAGYEADAQEMMQASYVFLGLDEVTYEDLERIFRRFHGLPWEIMETKRLQIREFCMDDLDALCMLYEKPHVTDFIEPLYEREQERQYQKNYIEKIYGMYGFGMWLLFDKSSGELMGRAGLEYRETCQDGELEMGYVIAPEYWRQGYATEACLAILRYAKDELKMGRVLCRVDEKNEASIRFLEKLGFVLREKQEECIYTLELVDFS